MKYMVTTEDKTFEITVEPMEESTPITPENGADVAFEAAKMEYDHCFQRSSKLDNKVYILLTVCAFLFVMLSEAIKKVAGFQLPTTKCQAIVSGGYIALLTINIFLFVWMLVSLIRLLKGVELKRFDSYEILGNDMIASEKSQVIRYICMMYEQCRDHNNKLIEDEYKTFNRCVKLMVANVAILLVAALYGALI